MNAWFSDTFAALREPRYRVLWLGTLTNFAALWMSIIARGDLTFDLTDSTIKLGLVVLGFGVPMLILTPVGGIIADRVPRKPVIVATQWSFAIISAVIAALILADAIEFWMLFVAALAEGAAVALGIPARQALIGDFVEGEELGNAIALQQVAFNAARVLLPSLAGVLIAIEVVGIGWTYVLLSTLYALGALIFMTLPETPRRVGVASTSFMSDLAEGVRYIRSRPSILTLVVVAYIVELTVFPYVFFLPAYVEELLGLGSSEESSVQFGLLTTIIAVGALVTSLWVANIADRAQAWTVHAVSAVLFGVLLVLMAVGPPVFEQFAIDIWPSVEDWTLFGIALTPAYVAALGIGILIGAAEIGFLGLNQSLAMKYAHPQFYGRVQAVLLLGFALNGWSGLPIGILAEAIGLLETFAILGVVGAIGAALALAWGSRRGAREDAVAPAETVELDPVAARERASLVASG